MRTRPITGAWPCLGQLVRRREAQDDLAARHRDRPRVAALRPTDTAKRGAADETFADDAIDAVLGVGGRGLFDARREVSGDRPGGRGRMDRQRRRRVRRQACADAS